MLPKGEILPQAIALSFLLLFAREPSARRADGSPERTLFYAPCIVRNVPTVECPKTKANFE
jgi:hypothetical protein